MINWKKWLLSRIKRGTRVERYQICFVMHFLCLQSKSFVNTSIFHFGTSNCFVIAKEEFQKNLITKELNWLSHMTDYEDTLQTPDWANSAKNMTRHPILSTQFSDMSLSQGHIQDMSGTFPTKLWRKQWVLPW